MNLDPITVQGRSISDLFVLALALSAVVFLLVVGVLAYVIVRFRARGEVAEPQQVEGSRGLEIAWSVAPFVVLAVLFVLALRTLATVDAAAPSALRIRVVGHQWWWEYQYPDLGVRTANELHVPVGAPLLLEIVSADVIHSFWVPAFGWKRDAVPGKINTMRLDADREGRFDGACTEFCGPQHAWMRVDTVVESREQFDTWTAAQRAAALEPQSDAAKRGKAIFLGSTCASCHTVRGVTAAAQVGPDLTHVGSRATIGAGVLASSRDDLRRWITQVQSVKPGALMPSYASLAEPDADAVAAYLESLK